MPQHFQQLAQQNRNSKFIDQRSFLMKSPQNETLIDLRGQIQQISDGYHLPAYRRSVLPFTLLAQKMKSIIIALFVILAFAACNREGIGTPETKTDPAKKMNDTSEPTPIERWDSSDEYAQKILTPDWDIVEKHFGVEAPPILKSLYNDPPRVLLKEFDVVSESYILEEPEFLHVVSYSPIGESTLSGSFDDMERYFPIAIGLGGEEFVIDISETDPKVYFYQYDIGDDPEKLQFTGLVLSEFISAEKVPTQRFSEE